MPTNRLPTPLSERQSSRSQALYARQGREVDVAVGGVPFRLATTSELPQSLETIPIRKEQVDTESDPGEQSLSGWWRRAQASFHEGAGYLYQEDSTQLTDSEGYWDSRGVEVFEKGKISLLKAMETAGNSSIQSNVRVSVRDSAGITWLSFVSDGDLYYYPQLDLGVSEVLVWNPAAAVIDGLLTGDNFYAITDDGNLTRGVALGAPVLTSWPLGATGTAMQFGLHRLWVIGGRNIWQPDVSLADTTAQTAIFTNPNEGWTYTCMAESPAGMLFGGHDGLNSSIQIVSLDAGGGLPTLTGATVIASLPSGEIVQQLSVLGGFLVGIGTNKGFRVGVLNGNTLTYGPLLFEPAGMTACTAIATHGRFFYIAVKATENLVYRVDTSVSPSDGVYAYAPDVDCGGLEVMSLAAAEGRIFATTSDGDRWHQSGTEYVSTGWLQTGRIRFRTTEPKFFRSLQVEHDPLAGAIAVEAVREGDTALPVATLNDPGEGSDRNFLIGFPTALRYMSVKLTLLPSGDLLETPVVNSYQVSAMPVVRPQRLLTIPLLCFDKEQGRSGQWYGGLGFARERLTSLLEIEDGASIVTLQEFSSAGAVGQPVIIERIRFVQTAPPTTTVSGPGGILILELRTADI